MLKALLKPLMAALIVVSSFAAFTATAADDPSLHAIYEAANSGKLAAAQDMIDTVLRDHPESGKAHYVAAELDARQGKLAAAREQLQSAEKLSPGLPFAKPESVRALRAQLGVNSTSSSNVGSLSALTPRPVAAAPPARSGLSPGFLIGIVAVIGFVAWMIFRRRPAPQYQQGYPANGNGYGAAGNYGGPGGMGYPQQGNQGGGIGSGIAGGLASGLAVGAGVVAGEALAHRFMDGGGEHERFVDRPQEHSDPNSNMGGDDFGVSDSSSWDDNSGVSDSGGGDDWS